MSDTNSTVRAVTTLQMKLRPGSADWLNSAASEVNMIWNHLNEVSSKAARPFYGLPKENP